MFFVLCVAFTERFAVLNTVCWKKWIIGSLSPCYFFSS